MGLDIQMECFYSLAKTMNFSETARQLYISQQAVSKNISTLESKVGFPLFYRNPHNVTLTPWGEQFKELNSNFLRDVSMLREDYQKGDSILRVLTLDQPDFEPIKKLHPFFIPESNYKLNIQLTFDNPVLLIEQLTTRKVDMVITIDRFVPDLPGLISYPVHDLEAAILVSKNHPLYKEGVDFMTFKNETFICGVLGSNFFHTQDSILNDIREFNLSPRSIMLLPSSEEALAATARGEGIILGSVMSKPHYENEIATIPTGVVNHIVCVWNERGCKTYNKAFAEFVRSEFQNAKNDREGKHRGN